VSGPARGFVGLATALGVAAPLLVLGAAIGSKLGLLNAAQAFDLVIGKLALAAAIGGVLAGLVGLALALRQPRAPELLRPCLIGLVGAAGTLIGVGAYLATAARNPPIHDVSTNWEEPVGPTRVMKAFRHDHGGAPIEDDPRVPAPAGPPWAGKRVAEVNAQTCPGAKPITRMLDPDDVVAALGNAGVQVIGRSPFRVEGVTESYWFGLNEDVMVRIRPGRTDVRSVSHDDRPDRGVNCARVTKIIQALSK
jgi:fatty-acyl-CoA synthase